jgi:flavin reductase (DIM6/NTAB) family NADH-FMN oxidoreductase RutF
MATVIGEQSATAPVELAFREAMSLLVSGVVMVTTRIDERPWGLTISSCCSFSAAPPQILISLGSHTVTADRVSRSRKFGVALLSTQHRELAEYGSAPGSPKFVDDHCFDDHPDVSPRVRDALYHLDCHVTAATTLADHTVFIGEVVSVVAGSRADEPLVYYNRNYHQVGSHLR